MPASSSLSSLSSLSSSSSTSSSSSSRMAVVARQRLLLVVAVCFVLTLVSAEQQRAMTIRRQKRQQPEQKQPQLQQQKQHQIRTRRQQRRHRQRKATSRPPPADPTRPFGPEDDFTFFMEFDEEEERDDMDERENNGKDGYNDSFNNNVAVGNNPKIVGGLSAENGRFPFFVQGHGCGASLIAPDMILSAAHCFGYLDYSPMDTMFPQKQPDNRQGVWVGAVQSFSPSGGAQQRRIVAEIIHPKYDDYWVTHDFLVAKLDRPVQGIRPVPFSRSGNPQSVPTTTTTDPYPPPFQYVKAIGFGDVFSHGPAPKELQKVRLTTFSDERCNQVFDIFYDPELHMCAGHESVGTKKRPSKSRGGKTKKKKGAKTRRQDQEGLLRRQQRQRDLGKKAVQKAKALAKAKDYKGVCNGDSGGPLLYQGTQVGIVSFGKGHCAHFPAVYSRVSSASDWIREQVCWFSDYPPDYCFTSPIESETPDDIIFNHTLPTPDPAEETEPPLPVYFPIYTTRVDFQYDNYVHETIWSIVAQEDGQVILYRSNDYYSQQNKHTVNYVDGFRANTTYVLRVEDMYGDGITKGYINITYIDSATERTSLLNYGLDFYFYNISVTFTTPSWLLSDMD